MAKLNLSNKQNTIFGTFQKVPDLNFLNKQNTFLLFVYSDLGLEGSEGAGEGTGKWEFSLRLSCSDFSQALKIISYLTLRFAI